MAQQFDSPKTETQLREIQDRLYQRSSLRPGTAYQCPYSLRHTGPRAVGTGASSVKLLAERQAGSWGGELDMCCFFQSACYIMMKVPFFAFSMWDMHRCMMIFFWYCESKMCEKGVV